MRNWPGYFRTRLAERLIFMTSGAFAPKVQEFLAGLSNPCVSKPVDTQELRKLLRHVMQ